MAESRAKWQWKASGVVAAVSLCHVLKGTSAIFFSIEDSSTIRSKMNTWSFRDCMARIVVAFCEPIIVLSPQDTWCRYRVNQLHNYVTKWRFHCEWGQVLVAWMELEPEIRIGMHLLSHPLGKVSMWMRKDSIVYPMGRLRAVCSIQKKHGYL